MTFKQNHKMDTSKFKKTISKRKTLTQEQIDEKIAKKAYELYENRGRIDGSAEDDWIQARTIVLAELESEG